MNIHTEECIENGFVFLDENFNAKGEMCVTWSSGGAGPEQEWKGLSHVQTPEICPEIGRTKIAPSPPQACGLGTHIPSPPSFSFLQKIT